MAVNVLADAPNGVTALATASFASAGITSTNTSVIYLVDSSGKVYASYNPLDGDFNAITGFVAGKSYLIIAKMDMDLTAYVGPPFAAGGGSDTESSFYS
jgi:hypothetical protein